MRRRRPTMTHPYRPAVTVGSLFTGYGGLELALGVLLDVELQFVADTNPAASRVLAYRWPDVPNLGDVTAVDWSTVPRVDIVTGGFPCQDVSHGGTRQGLTLDTRSGLWAYMAIAIEELRPAVVVVENVGGLLSAWSDSGDVGDCPFCMGDDSTQSVVRALGAVLGDLTDLGFDTDWSVVSAAEIGAPHRRERVVVVAHTRGEAESIWRRLWPKPVPPAG